MFPNTHLFCTQKIIGASSPLFLYGSIFPDIPITKLISWEKMKAETESFSRYVRKSNANLKNFASGLLLHEEPCGIDRFVHGEEGFAFVHGRKILPKIEIYFPKDSIDAAHSFIEFAVEILITLSNPSINEIKKEMLKKIILYEEEMARVFSEFFKINSHMPLHAIKEYNSLLGYEITSRKNGVEIYTTITNRLRGTKLTEKEIEDLLELAINEIKDKYDNFLKDAISKCKKDLKKSGNMSKISLP